MCLFKRRKLKPEDKFTRQQRRKLQRDLVKITRKVRRKAERTLNDERIPGWIRAVKRSQLEAVGFLPKQ
jgi:hypothetical protein